MYKYRVHFCKFSLSVLVLDCSCRSCSYRSVSRCLDWMKRHVQRINHSSSAQNYKVISANCMGLITYPSIFWSFWLIELIDQISLESLFFAKRNIHFLSKIFICWFWFISFKVLIFFYHYQYEIAVKWPYSTELMSWLRLYRFNHYH